MSATNEVRVTCEHGQVTTFVASIPGVWIIRTQSAERVTYPDGAERWYYSMRCDRCRLDVPVVNPDVFGPVLDRLVQADSPAIMRATPTVIEVPLKLMADALGAPRKLPE